MSKIHEIGPASTRWRCRWEALRSIGSDILNFLSIGRRVYGRTEMDVTGRLLVSVFIRKFRRHATGYDRPWLTFTADPFIFLLFSSGRKKLLFDLFPVACVMSIEDVLIRHLAPLPPPSAKKHRGQQRSKWQRWFFFFRSTVWNKTVSRLRPDTVRQKRRFALSFKSMQLLSYVFGAIVTVC